jgi:hypothetical protein
MKGNRIRNLTVGGNGFYAGGVPPHLRGLLPTLTEVSIRQSRILTFKWLPRRRTRPTGALPSGAGSTNVAPPQTESCWNRMLQDRIELSHDTGLRDNSFVCALDLSRYAWFSGGLRALGPNSVGATQGPALTWSAQRFPLLLVQRISPMATPIGVRSRNGCRSVPRGTPGPRSPRRSTRTTVSPPRRRSATTGQARASMAAVPGRGHARAR